MSGGNGRAFITPSSSSAHAHNRDRPRRDLLVALRERAHIAHALLADRHDADACVEFVLELQRAVIVERGGHPRKANVGATRGDADSGRAPQRVLRLFHVAEVDAEMDDARGVDFVERHTTAEGEFGEGHLRSSGPRGRWGDGAKVQSEGPKVRRSGPEVRRSEGPRGPERPRRECFTLGPPDRRTGPSHRRPVAPSHRFPSSLRVSNP